MNSKRSFMEIPIQIQVIRSFHHIDTEEHRFHIGAILFYVTPMWVAMCLCGELAYKMQDRMQLVTDLLHPKKQHFIRQTLHQHLHPAPHNLSPLIADQVLSRGSIIYMISS